MSFKDFADQCTLEQYHELVKLEERLRIAEAAMKLLEMNQESESKKPDVSSGGLKKTKSMISNGGRALSTRAKVTIPNSSDIPKVAQLRKRFEMNNRSSKVLTAVTRALRLGKDARPPQRPMTLARVPPREGGSGA